MPWVGKQNKPKAACKVARAGREAPMARTWQIQEAKDKLGEVIEEAIQHGPQIISREGTEIAVVLSYEEYLVLKGARTNLAQFFLESPLPGSGLELKRDRSEKDEVE